MRWMSSAHLLVRARRGGGRRSGSVLRGLLVTAVEELGNLIAVDEAGPPFGVVSGGGLGGFHFLERPSLVDQTGDPGLDVLQHVAVGEGVVSGGKGSMAGNDLGPLVRQGNHFVGRGDDTLGATRGG